MRAFVLRSPHLDGEPGEYPEGIAIEAVRQAPRRIRQAGAFLVAAAGGAYSPRLYASRRLRDTVRAAALSERPAWVVAQSYHVARAALGTGAPSWVDFHNVDSRIWERLGDAGGGSAPARLFARVQAPRVRAFERDALRRAGGASCVSALDAETLAAIGGAPTAPLVVPNGVDLARYAVRREAPSSELVVFVGDLTWAPNVDGIRWFRRRVWPAVKRLRPGARAEVLGRGGGRLGLDAEDFALLGAGGDTRPLWGRAGVAVVPLFAGGGTRLKILEAAASGVPVVSTRVGAEGLSFEAEREILLRDDPEQFASAVAALLARPEAAARQAAAARARVERSYDWKRIGAAFAGELARRAERRA